MIAIKASIVVACACAATAMMRQRSAATRHAVLAGSLGCAGLLPLFERLAPGWGFAGAASAASLAAAAEGDLLRGVWLGGVAIGLATLAAGLVRLARLQSRARRADDPRRLALLDESAREFGIHREVRLLESHDRLMPVTWGFVRPHILLPAASRDWPDDRIRAVLRHELAHIRRGDWPINLAAEVIARLLWVAPLVWFAKGRLRLESERACDDAVLNVGVDGAEYAAHVISVARGLRRAGSSGAAPAMAGGLLERRVAAALDAGLNRAPLTAPVCVAVLALLVALTLPIAGYGLPTSPAAAAPYLLDVQRDILRRFGGEERRFSIVTRDVSFWKNRIEGRVELQARLNVDGSLSGVRLVEPVHPDLASAAAVIVRQWRREPARVRGVPVEIPIRMTVDFRP